VRTPLCNRPRVIPTRIYFCRSSAHFASFPR